ncbi:succinylglutamate desuccinylase [Candidatus Ishikawella capsulata]|uniref:succinylglutamate desuccinylase n=1 Tax=Candidatus Ishikawella capsulata TaxID=168169 RepID=UPI000597E5FB|nr:succinylglutamate desuccinylase [Candidatus Ishikawaella capsulata]
MWDFLQQTLSGKVPIIKCNENTFLKWKWWDEGVLELIPHNNITQQTMVISCGLHGNETAPVEMLNKVLNTLIHGKQPLYFHLLVILGNPAALRIGKRFVDYDINRLFGINCYKMDKHQENRRAKQLEEVIKEFWKNSAKKIRWHIDLHTALRRSYHTNFGILPLKKDMYSKNFLDWLTAAGLEALVFQSMSSNTFTNFSCEIFNSNSCTLELGTAKPFGKNNLAQINITYIALSRLLSYGTILKQFNIIPQHYRVTQQLIKLSKKFVLHMSNNTLNFTSFRQNTLLAEDGLTRYFVQQDHEYIIFPNPNVSIGQRAGLMLKIEE